MHDDVVSGKECFYFKKRIVFIESSNKKA